MSKSASGLGDPPKELMALRDRLAEVFDAGGAVGPVDGEVRDVASSWAPQLDVASNDTSTVVTVEVTGVAAKDLEVLLEGANLTVRGERRRDTEGVTYHRIERGMGRFERVVELSRPVDAARAVAYTDNGILSIALQHVDVAPAEPHVIAVGSKKPG